MFTKLKNLKKSDEGFTIIEVMIVLAIAGLILLIVFLAVPALQRNGRNTTKRSDADKALGAVGEFASNNNGNVPNTAAQITAIQTSANLNQGTTLVAGVPPTTVAGITTAPTVNQILIATGVTCNNAATHTTAAAPTAANYQAEVQAGSTRAYVALYNVEAAGGQLTTQCAGS